MKKLAALILSCLLLLTLVACSSPEADKSASGASWTIEVEGTDQGAVKFTDKDAEALGIISIKAAVKDKDSSLPEQEWEGVSLEQLLEHFGVRQYVTVKVEGADGSFNEYTPDLVATSNLLLGLKADGKTLDAQTGPVRLVANGKGPKWWINNVVKITVNK